MTVEETKYWYKFRQVVPQPPGQWVVCGPFETYEEAKKARTASKAYDSEVSVPFTAATTEDAEKSPW